MKNTALIAMLIFLSLVFCAWAQALEVPIVYTAPPININAGTSTFLDSLNNDQDAYANSPVSKAGDGTLNAVSAWVDIPRGISEETQDSNLFLGLTIGLGKGLVTGVKREAAGIVDVATCGFPPYDKPLMAPEYKVNNPDQNGLKLKILSW
ncbi:MAG: exosortase system-associated protein, TIGR04073 family [Candidatus Omnitrophota bacterium]